MQGLFDLLKMPDSGIRSRTLDALITIVSQNYRYMGPYLEPFYLMAESFIECEDDDGRIAQSSVEVWSSLFEEELAEQAPTVVGKVDIIKKYQWQKVANLFLRGLQRTGLDAAQEDGDDQEQSVSLACQTALNLLAQVVKDGILELTFEYFKQLRAHDESNQGQPGQWLIRHVGMLALCSSLEGPQPSTLQSAYGPQLGWVFQNATGGPLLLRRGVARFFGLVALHCPDLIVEDSNTFDAFQQWYESCLSNEKPEVVLGAAQAMSYLFVRLEQATPAKNFKLNGRFVAVIQATVRRVLDRSLMEAGYLSPVMDCLNDMTQHCDHVGLSDALHQLCRSIVAQLEESILHDGNP